MSWISGRKGFYLKTVSSLSWCWFAASLVAFPNGAAAQTPIPSRETIDANGVDLIRGIFTASATDVSIGPAGPHGLRYTRNWRNNNWRNNLSSGIGGWANGILVTIDNTSYGFSSPDGYSYVPDQTDGSSLYQEYQGDWVYTSANGTVVRFYDGVQNGYNPGYAQMAYIKSITYPDGVVVNYNYRLFTNCQQIGNRNVCSKSQRLESVFNNLGYGLRIAYQSDNNNIPGDISWYTIAKVTAVNTKVPGCDPNADSCSSIGAWPSATYDAYSPTTVTGPGGRVTHYSYDSTGRLTGWRRPGASSDDVTISYVNNAIVQSVTKFGSTWNYSYNDNSASQRHTVTINNPNGTHRTLISDIGTAEPLSLTDETGQPTSYLFNVDGHLASVTYPEGNENLFEYDTRGNVTKTTWTSKTNINDNFSTTAGYEATCSNLVTCNQPVWTRDARGNQTDYQYDPTHGGVTVSTAPAGASGIRPQTRYSYTGYSDQVGGTIYLPTQTFTCRTQGSCDGTSDQIVTSADYGSLSNNLLPQSMTKRAGDNSLSATASTSYDAIGNLIVSTNPLGAQTRYSYNADREVTESISADPDGGGPLRPRAVRMNYNVDGTVASTEVGTDTGGNFQSMQQLVYGYDGYGRKLEEAASANGVTSGVTDYAYDVMGRLQCTAVRMNPTTFANHTGACTLAAQGGDGLDRITSYDYDARNMLQKVTSGFGTNVQVDVIRTTYTFNGQVQTRTDANNNTTSYGYDVYDRPSITTYPDGSFEQLQADVTGNVTSRRLRDGQTLTYSYDALNRRTYDTNPKTNVAEVDVSYSYDLLGHLLQAQDQNGWYKAYEYDALGRVTREHSNIADNYLQYDAAGRRTRQTWGDGIFVTYDYDTLGEMTAIHENGGFVLASFGYDDLGRRTSLSRGNGTSTSYGYDAASRLTSLSHSLVGASANQSFTYGYNPAGQITSRTASNDAYAWNGAYNVDRSYGVNGLNQYTSAGGTTFGYDGRGNLTNSGGTTYGYNSRNQLFQGPQGQLIYHNPAGELGQVPGTNFDWVGGQLATESGSAIQRRYVYGPGADEVLVWYEGSGTNDRRWLHADERGSVIAVSDGAGNASTINTYDEYGIPGANNSGRFQYTGQAWLPEVGLYDYKARMYSPTLGRFMQTDPIGYGDGMNWYNYVGSDPVNGIDPSGTQDITSDIVVTGIRDNSIGDTLGSLILRANGPLGSSSVFIPNTDGDYPNTITVTGTREKRVGLGNPDLQISFSSTTALTLADIGLGSPQNDLQAIRDVVVNGRRPKAWINYSYPGFFSHVSARHFGFDYTFGSVFRSQFQNEASLLSLASFAANNAPLRNTSFPGVYRYTANYTGTVGYLQGSGLPTSLITLIVRDTGTLDQFGQRVLQPVTLYPGAGLP